MYNIFVVFTAHEIYITFCRNLIIEITTRFIKYSYSASILSKNYTVIVNIHSFSRYYLDVWSSVSCVYLPKLLYPVNRTRVLYRIRRCVFYIIFIHIISQACAQTSILAYKKRGSYSKTSTKLLCRMYILYRYQLILFTLFYNVPTI